MSDSTASIAPRRRRLRIAHLMILVALVAAGLAGPPMVWRTRHRLKEAAYHENEDYFRLLWSPSSSDSVAVQKEFEDFLKMHAEIAKVYRRYAWRPWDRLPEEYRIDNDPYQ
jgi:hypothetical protein